jgi:ribulose-bisphosphate carboxylase large chain
MSEWYHEFVNQSYSPSVNDLIALFKLQPSDGFSVEEAAGRVASESSIGTWTEVGTLKPRMRRLMAEAYSIKENLVKVAYPIDLFEPSNMPQVLSSIAGNIFGMKAVRHVRLEDIRWPRKLLRSFQGPQYGISGIRKILQVKDRPLTATVPKPKLGMTATEHATAGFEAWMGGIDLLKDDENLSSQRFNTFEKRVKLSLKMRDKAEKITGDNKSYLINITAETEEMRRRAKLVKRTGGEIVMIDILTAGWAALQTMREACNDLGLAIHAHRAFHAAFTRNPDHGMSMLAVSDVARAIGVDLLHIGTVIGKLESPRDEVVGIRNNLQNKHFQAIDLDLTQDWQMIKPTFPVSSGGLHPGLVPELIKLLGTNIVIQSGGGVWGHSKGGREGAAALRQSIDATLDGTDLTDYANSHPELREALNTWGKTTYV